MNTRRWGLTRNTLQVIGKSTYVIRGKKIVTNALDNGDPIIKLLSEFDMEELTIGMITFNNELKEINGFWLFGKFEVDELAIDRSSKEIVMLEESTNRLLLDCALDSSHFLDAIIYIGKFLERSGVGENLYEDEDINLTIAEESARIAGGQKV